MAAAIRRLVGREAELAAVVALLDDPCDLPGVAVLEGEAGIGKTALWLAVLDAAAVRGFRVLSTRPSDVEAGWSYSGLADLIGAAAAEVLPRLPSVQHRALEAALLLGEDGTVTDERAVAAATLSALRVLAEEQPVVVAVDDVQWLDRATLAALRFALPRLESEPVATVLAVRGSAPEWLLRAVAVERLRIGEIGPLSLGATHELLRTRLDASFARPTLIRIWETSRGNPFFALELAAALQRRGGTLAVGEELPVPTSLDALLRSRLDSLDAAAIEVAQVVAALAEPTVQLVESIVAPLEAGLGDAFEARILELDGERLRFTHPLLGPAVSGRLTRPQRLALHAQLARFAPTSEQRARHLALATDEPDADIAAALEDAAREAHARGAPAAAAELAERAFALTPPAARADALRRLLFAARRSFVAGDARRARALLERARMEAEPGAQRAEALVELADVISESTNDERTTEPLYRQALAEADGDVALEARIHTDLAEFLSDFESATVHARLAVEAAVRSGDPALECSARAVHATCRLWAGQGLQRAELEEAMALERTLPDWPIESGPTEYLSLHLMSTFELAEARAMLVEILGALRARDDIVGEAWHLRGLTLLEWRAGDWEAAERYAAESRDLCDQAGMSRTIEIAGLALAAHRGRIDDVRARVHARTDGDASGFELGTNAWALGFVELSLGDASSAVGHLRRSHEILDKVTLEPAMRFGLGDHLEALVAVGELDEAEQVLATWEQRAAALDRAWALAILARCRGLVLAARGDLEAAFDEFERALAEHARATDPFQLARTLLALGRTERRAKRRAAARNTLTDALARFDRLGAPLWAEQTRSELARIGGRAPAGDGLTEAEQRIASLVAQGKTNREVAATLFVTPHSVENALTRIYRKLDVRSRAELAARSLTPEHEES